MISYTISDPVFENLVEADKKSLTKARFVKGVMAPKGSLYYPLSKYLIRLIIITVLPKVH